MKKITPADIVQMLKEEYKRRLAEFDITSYQGQKSEEDVLTKGLKVRHGKSNILYTIRSIGLQDIILVTPEGKQICVTKDELEKEYELD